MLKQAEVIEKLQEAIKEIFNSTGTVKATRTGFAGTRLLNQEIKPDLVIQAETKEKEKYLIVLEVKSAGQPRYARMAANQLQSIRANRENVYGVFGAPFVSEESKKICQETGIGYLDGPTASVGAGYRFARGIDLVPSIVYHHGHGANIAAFEPVRHGDCIRYTPVTFNDSHDSTGVMVNVTIPLGRKK